MEAGGGQKGQKQRSSQQKDTGRAVGLPWLSSQGTEPWQPHPCWSERKHQGLNDILGAHQGTLFPRRIKQIRVGGSCPPHFMGRTQLLCTKDPKNTGEDLLGRSYY